MAQQIPLTETGILPKLIQDYLLQKDALLPFYQAFPTIENFKKQLALKSFSQEKRNTLHKALTKQYEAFNKSNRLQQNIDALLKSNTFTVTTAHQANIFTGPLYVIYKILHSIQLANTLQQYFTDYQIVPVYWIGSEDHDFEELNHIHIEQQTFTWQDKQGGATGRYKTESLQQLLETIKQTLQHEPFFNEVFPLFEKAYTQNKTLAAATQYLINELLGEHGIVVLNQDDALLKQQFSSVIKKELLQKESYPQATATSQQLSALGYEPQAVPREINLFYVEENSRERIVYEPQQDVYKIFNTNQQYSATQLLEILDKNPEKFSSNVFLRPLYQEIVLPNLAYVGGSGELSYWLQQKGIFNIHKETFPLLVHRNTFTLLEPAVQKKLEKLKLKVSDFWKDEQEIIKQYIATNITLPNFETEQQQLKEIYAAIKTKAELVDSTLKATADAQLQQAINALENLEKKIVKAAKQKEEQSIAQIKVVQQKIKPNNVLQERYDNILGYYCRYGLQLNNTLLNAVSPLHAQMNIISL